MVSVTRFRRALVPLDGSPSAETILPAFADLARSLGIEMVLIQVVAHVTPQMSEGGRRIVDPSERLRQEAGAYLRGRAQSLDARGISARATVRVGDPAREIVEAARADHCDLIAMTTHARRGLRRLLFGSVAESVLRLSPVPVFVQPLPETETMRPAA